jgi:K+-sensing histidine kinase KdpD
MQVESIVWPCAPCGKRDTFLCRYGSATLLVLFAVGIPFRLPVFQELSYVLAFSAVVMSGLWGGLGPAVFSASISAVAINFFFIEPYYRLSFSPDPEEAFRTAVFLVSAIMVAAFVADARRTRQRLDRSEERYRALADTSPDALIVVDEHATIVYVNSEVEKVFQCAASSVLGQQLAHWVPKPIYEGALWQLKLQRDSRKPSIPLDLLPSTHKSVAGPIELTGGTLARHGGDLFALRMRARIAYGLKAPSVGV